MNGALIAMAKSQYGQTNNGQAEAIPVPWSSGVHVLSAIGTVEDLALQNDGASVYPAALVCFIMHAPALPHAACNQCHAIRCINT